MLPPQTSTELRTYGRDGAALVQRVANGDESAFATLHDRTCGLIFGMLLRILGNSSAAEEVLADVYKEVREQCATYDIEHEALLTWLMTIAYSRAIARLKASSQNQQRAASFEIVKHTSAVKPKTDDPTSEWKRRVRSTLDALSPAQRQMIELEYFLGLSLNDIAMRLGLSLQSVQTAIQDAMMKLRELANTSRSKHSTSLQSQ